MAMRPGPQIRPAGQPGQIGLLVRVRLLGSGQGSGAAAGGDQAGRDGLDGEVLPGRGR